MPAAIRRYSKLRSLCSSSSNFRRTRRRCLFESLENRSLLAGFNFADFSDTTGLNLIDNAAITQDNRLRLTENAVGLTGAAWYAAEKQYVAAAFSTTFQFKLGDSPTGSSDGFVFAIQNSNPSYVGGGGGNLAYNGLANSLVVEFDTYLNADRDDTSESSISVHTAGVGANSTHESKSLGHYDTSPIMDDGNVHTVKIDYQTGTLSIYLDNLTTPKLTVAVDLADKLALADGRAWVGFTGACGGGAQTHDILNWMFDAPTAPTTIVSIGDVAGVEGNSGTASFEFTVTRLGDASGATTVNWSTANGTATAGSDFTAATGSLTFNPLEITKTIAVAVAGDTTVEQHETFTVNLSGISGGDLADATGSGTILNDETTFAIADAVATEGNPSFGFLGNLVSAGVGGLDNPYGMTYGPDGLLYVCTIVDSSILRYDPTTGAPRPAPGKTGAEFVSPGAGGLIWPRQIGFGPDGNLYAASQNTDSVLRFDAATGAPLGALVPSGVGGISRPKGLTFASDGYLYVTNGGVGNTGPGSDSVLRYDAVSGAPEGVSRQPDDAVFVPSGFGGLDEPDQAVLHNGILYVSSSLTNSVLRYASDGSPLTAFVSSGSGGLTGPSDLQFHGGFLYVVSTGSNQVLRYAESTGAFEDVVVPATGGLGRPIGLRFQADGSFFVSSLDSDEIRHYGAASQLAFTVSLSAPSGIPVTVDYATVADSADASDFEATSGTITFAPGQTSRTILVETINNSAIEVNETFTIDLSTPVGGDIIDGSGVGTISDDDTKFYVVDDGSANKTFEYGSGAGAAGENYSLAGGNATPRGAASTAAGDKVWVVDANKSVYVYSSAGTLLGSWAASGLSQPEGIATDGTDIWIVDAGADKVFKYTGAASAVSGSRSPSTDPKQSFKLNSGNKTARDIVMHGAWMWVVNNSSTDKVFKYALNGALAGSWTISGGGGSPTGITLDPSSPSHLWIVDNTTDRVYQYDAAIHRTSGSQAASGSFALVGGTNGNLNPQGIADPPVGEPAVLARETIVTRPTFADLVFADLRPVREATLRPTRKLPPPVVSTTPVVPIRTLDTDRPQIVDDALTDYLREESVGRNKCTHAVPADSQWMEDFKAPESK